MVKHRLQPNKSCSYFITFTCIDFLPIIEHTKAYESFYTWFEYLKINYYPLFGYVIMPNHFHDIIQTPESSKKNINQIVANAKRLISYFIIHNLEKNDDNKYLRILNNAVTRAEKEKGQKHKVFKTSFDCKEILHSEMMQTKIDYIHSNPCQGNWNLAKNYLEYPHSSASFYELDEENKWITSYGEFL